MDEHEKLAICKVVAQAIMLDRHITDDELALLNGMMDRYALTPEQRHDVTNRNLGEDVGALVDGLGQGTRAELLAKLASALFEDGDLRAVERDLIEIVTLALKLPKAEVNRIMAKAGGGSGSNPFILSERPSTPHGIDSARVEGPR